MESSDTSPDVVRTPERPVPVVFGAAVIFRVWLPINCWLGAANQLVFELRNHWHTSKLLDTDNCWVPPDAAKLRADGDDVRLQELGFRVADNVKVTLPLARVTVSISTRAVLFGVKVAVILDAPVPDVGEIVWFNETSAEMLAVQAQDAGVVTKLQVTLVAAPFSR
jgi:hypothetical protein